MVELESCNAFTAYGFIVRTKKSRKGQRDGDLAELRTKHLGMDLWCCCNKHYLQGLMVKLRVVDVSLAGIITCKLSLPVMADSSTALFAEQWHSCVTQEVNYTLLKFKVNWWSRVEVRAETRGEMMVMDTVSNFEFGCTSKCLYVTHRNSKTKSTNLCVVGRESNIRKPHFVVDSTCIKLIVWNCEGLHFCCSKAA